MLPLMLLHGHARRRAVCRRSRRFLKTRFNTNEILTSLMLVYVAQLFLDWLVRGAWRDPEGFNFPDTRALSAAAPSCRRSAPSPGRAHCGIVFALIAAVAGLVHAVATR